MSGIGDAFGRRFMSLIDPDYSVNQRLNEWKQKSAEELRQSRLKAQQDLQIYERLMKASPELAEQISAIDLRAKTGQQELLFADRGNQTQNQLTVLDAAADTKARLADNATDNRLKTQGGTVRDLARDYHNQDQALTRMFVGDGNLTDKLIGASERRNLLAADLVREQMAASKPSGLRQFTDALVPVLAVASLFA